MPIVRLAAVLVTAAACVLPAEPLFVSAHVATHASGAGSVTCTPTGFYRDNINLTAALIDPSGTVTGTVNATGCNIAIYYGAGQVGKVSGAHIFGANYFGVVNDGGTVTIQKSYIHNIGEVPFNGDQHGVAIYFSYASGASGQILNNVIWDYQKGGIVNNAGYSTISGNTVLGQGPVNYIAQNGIQLGYGATGTVQNNNVIGNSYTGSNLAASGGILVVGGACYGGPVSAKVKINKNVVIGNDVGVWLSNLDIDPINPNACIPTASVTRILTTNNIATNDAINNTTGYSATAGYQAGISDQGNYDYIGFNSICGVGYTPVTPPPYLYAIDTTVTNNVTVTGNTTCSGTGSSPKAPAHRSSTNQRASAIR